MNPITGKEIHIQPGTVMKIQEFCKLTSSNYFNVANNDVNNPSNYIIKFPDEYKDIADQFPDLFINKYNECLLVQNRDSRSWGYTGDASRTYSVHCPVGSYTLPQYMLAVCFASTWYHIVMNNEMKYYSGKGVTISCMHYPVNYNKKFNNVYDSVMVPNVHNKCCTVHYYTRNDGYNSFNDIIYWELPYTFFKHSSYICGNKMITNKINKYVQDIISPVVTNIYTEKDKTTGNEFNTILGNNEMIAINGSSVDNIFVS